MSPAPQRPASEPAPSPEGAGPTDAEIAALYDRYAHVIFHRARQILHNDEEAQDAVQETFARVIHHWESFRHEASPLTWMYRISTNWCLNQLRNKKGRRQKREARTHDIVGEGVSWLRPQLEAELVRELIAEADEETQRIVIHLYFDDMTREETAKLVGLSVPTLRKRLRAFLKQANLKLTMDRRHAALATASLLGCVLSSWGLP